MEGRKEETEGERKDGKTSTLDLRQLCLAFDGVLRSCVCQHGFSSPYERRMVW